MLKFYSFLKLFIIFEIAPWPLREFLFYPIYIIFLFFNPLNFIKIINFTYARRVSPSNMYH